MTKPPVIEVLNTLGTPQPLNSAKYTTLVSQEWQPGYFTSCLLLMFLNCAVSMFQPPLSTQCWRFNVSVARLLAKEFRGFGKMPEIAFCKPETKTQICLVQCECKLPIELVLLNVPESASTVYKSNQFSTAGQTARVRHTQSFHYSKMSGTDHSAV